MQAKICCFYFLIFLMVTILIWGWNLSIGLLCISLMAGTLKFFLCIISHLHFL